MERTRGNRARNRAVERSMEAQANAQLVMAYAASSGNFAAYAAAKRVVYWARTASAALEGEPRRAA